MYKMKNKDLKDAGIIASEGKSEDSLYFSAVVVTISAIGCLIGVIVAVVINS